MVSWEYRPRYRRMRDSQSHGRVWQQQTSQLLVVAASLLRLCTSLHRPAQEESPGKRYLGEAHFFVDLFDGGAGDGAGAFRAVGQYFADVAGALL